MLLYYAFPSLIHISLLKVNWFDETEIHICLPVWTACMQKWPIEPACFPDCPPTRRDQDLYLTTEAYICPSRFKSDDQNLNLYSWYLSFKIYICIYWDLYQDLYQILRLDISSCFGCWVDEGRFDPQLMQKWSLVASKEYSASLRQILLPVPTSSTSSAKSPISLCF